MNYGIYYAYWQKNWDADFKKDIDNVAKLGFDILELGCIPLEGCSNAFLDELAAAAKDKGLKMTAGYGPRAEHNLASSDPAIIAGAKKYYLDMFQKLHRLGVTSLGGGLNSYWPVDYAKPVDKAGDWATSVKNMREVGKMAQEYDINLCIECLNRFEGYLTNTAKEGVRFCEDVGLPYVKVLMDTFHMNIEEDSFTEALVTAGARMGRLHVGEPNRKVPGKGRMPWHEIGQALRQIGYTGDVVLEPFVIPGGDVARDIKIWRDIEPATDFDSLNRNAKSALDFLRFCFEG